MGSVCNSNKKTIKIVIKEKPKTAEELPQVDFPLNQITGNIGQFFQYQLDYQKQETYKKKRQWSSIIQDKQQEFNQLNLYKQLREYALSSQIPEGEKQKNEIVDFINLAQGEDLDQESPKGKVETPVANSTTSQAKQSTGGAANSVSAPKYSIQELLLQQLFQGGKCSLLVENEMLLYIFRRQQPERFQELLKIGLPFDIRWSAWRIRLYSEESYIPTLYAQRLNQEGGDDANTTSSISKDIARTFPKHPYFQNDEQGNSQGQTQLYRILKALSVQFPSVGYCQGMNFLVGFILITSGNDDETFWFFKMLAESPDYLITGLFENDFPLAKILIDIFKNEFRLKMPVLYEHFEKEAFTEYVYVFKWVTTLFVYSFPFSVIYRFWDYLLSKDILAVNLVIRWQVVSLSLAILRFYQDKMLTFDMAEFSNFLIQIHQTEHILSDTLNPVYMDIDKVIEEAETTFVISKASFQDRDTQYHKGIKALLNKRS